VDLSWIHVFSVECVAVKRSFSLTHTRPMQMFEDVIALSENKWIGEELLTKRDQEIEDVDFVFAGPSCHDISSLNPSAKFYQNCIRHHCRATVVSSLVTLGFEW
jgi:phosphatidylserine/phosphatidylglycerophosphate/cardiolipin synthase-like enzyme